LQNSIKKKSVWNDQGGPVSYTVEDVQRVCEAALFNSIKLDLNGKPLAGTPEAAKLKRPARPVDPKILEPLGGNKTGFITKDPKTGKLMYQRQHGLVFPIVAWLGDPETHRKGGRYMRRRSRIDHGRVTSLFLYTWLLYIL
jgi:hypothetical protein